MGSTAKAESDGALNGPVPAELQAATLNSYSVPSIRRVTWETQKDVEIQQTCVVSRANRIS